MPHRTTQALEQSEVDLLTERLRLRLTRLSYLALALLVEQLLYRMGYTSVRLLGRRYLRGRTRIGGADLMASGRTDAGIVTTLVQVKRYTRVVSRRFVDELHGVIVRRRIPEGLSISTSAFSRQAEMATLQYPGTPIKLMDGRQLARALMFEGIGVTETRNLLTGEWTRVVDELAFIELEKSATEIRSTN